MADSDADFEIGEEEYRALLEQSIQGDGAMLVHCEECEDLIGVSKHGLDCGHSADATSHPLLDESMFTSPSLLDRVRSLLSR